jgi:non-ribosomal peptide synthetase component E (peptide arylation enzyme)
MRESDEFYACIRKYGVTVLSIPPSFFQLWVQFYGTNYSPPEVLRLIILGGDALTRKPLMAWKALQNVTARLINAYVSSLACLLRRLTNQSGFYAYHFFSACYFIWEVARV